MKNMTNERWNLLCETGKGLTEEEMVGGWHWCAEWDDLPIGPGMPEALCCNCGVPAVEEWKTSDEALAMRREQEDINEEYEIALKERNEELAKGQPHVLNEEQEPEMSDEEFFTAFGEEEESHDDEHRN